jgi:hypothetical protein
MSDRYQIDLDGSEDSVSVTMILSPLEAETIITVADALEHEKIQSRLEFAPLMRVTRLPEARPHRDLIAQLQRERDAITPKTPTNPVYNAYCRAVSSLKAIDGALYVQAYTGGQYERCKRCGKVIEVHSEGWFHDHTTRHSEDLCPGSGERMEDQHVESYNEDA